MTNKEFTVTSEAITPLISNNYTQIIFQRHGDYEDERLTEESVKDQTEIVKSFIKDVLQLQILL